MRRSKAVWGGFIAVLLALVMSIIAPNVTQGIGLTAWVGACMDMQAMADDVSALNSWVSYTQDSQATLNFYIQNADQPCGCGIGVTYGDFVPAQAQNVRSTARTRSATGMASSARIPRC